MRKNEHDTTPMHNILYLFEGKMLLRMERKCPQFMHFCTHSL